MLSLVYFLGVLPSPQFIEYLGLAASTVFYFDYLLTFSDEVKLLWGRRFSIVKVLFILSRYTVCFADLIRFLDYAYSWGDSEIDVICNASWISNEICTVVVSVAVAVFAALRLYVLWNRSYAVAASVLIPGLAGPLVMIYYDAHAVIKRSAQPDISRCTLGVRSQKSLTDGSDLLQEDMIYELMPLILCALSELVALASVWARTTETRKLMRVAGVHGSYTQLFLQQGTVYFSYIILTTLFCIFLYSSNLCVCNMFLSIFLCRFILDLRSIEDKDDVSSWEIRSIRFSPSASGRDLVDRVVDNIAAPVSCGEPGQETDPVMSHTSLSMASMQYLPKQYETDWS